MKQNRGQHPRKCFSCSNARNIKKFMCNVICIACAITLVLALAPALAFAATDHDHGLTHYEAMEASCTEPGNIEYWYCSTCDKYFSDATATQEITKEATIIPATGHDWGEGKVTKEPTCTETGVKTYTCNRCGEERTDVIPALGHDWDEGSVTKEPTCTETGVKTYTCNSCSEQRTDVIPAKGHDLASFEAKDETCTDPGNIEYWYCNTCGKYFSDEAATKQITKEDTIIPAKGHDLAHFEAKDETCTDPGNIEYWYCNTCDKYFSDEAATKQITKEDTIIPAKGHDWDEGNVTKEPTCTGTGEKTYTCKRCGETRTDVIPAKGHGTWVRSSGGTLTFTADYDYEDFISVYVDGVEIVKDKDYEVKKGSTIVTLKKAYLDGLENGTHEIEINWKGASEEIEFTVCDTEAEYPVTFDSMGGTAVNGQHHAKGEKLVKPADPTRTGYTFAGWYMDKNYTQAWNFDLYTVSGPTTLYAKWTAAGAGTGGSGTTPNTGDSNTAWPYAVLGILAAAAIAFTAAKKRRMQ